MGRKYPIIYLPKLSAQCQTVWDFDEKKASLGVRSPWPRHFRSHISILISRNRKSSISYSRHLVNTENFQFDFKKRIILEPMIYLSFELFSKVDLLLGIQSWILVAQIFFYFSSYFQCFFLPLWYLANIMCENPSPSWSEIRVDIILFYKSKNPYRK